MVLLKHLKMMHNVVSFQDANLKALCVSNELALVILNSIGFMEFYEVNRDFD